MKKSVMFGLLLAVFALAALAASPVYGGGEDGLEKAKQAQERHTDDLLAIQGVNGTAVGHGPQGRPAVFVLTERAGVKGIPNRIDGVPVVTRVVGKIVALNHKTGHSKGGKPPPEEPPPPTEEPTPPSGCTSTTEKFRPACIGISTGHPDITAGTIGARVIKVVDGVTTYYALSNFHVYAASNTASVGDAVIQPGTFDGGSSPDDDIGTLDDFEPIVFSTSANNVIDAAIALTSTVNLGNATPSDGYGTPKSTTIAEADVYVNQKVKKYGRTTGETKGQVVAINATIEVNYGAAGVARFIRQIVISPGSFSAGGDSGSLIVDNSKGKNKADARKPVGLLFAGSFLYTFANPIDEVLSRFGVTIDGE